MNDIAKKSVADRLIVAMGKEKLSAKETGAIIGILPAYISMMKNPDYHNNCPAKAWDLTLAWVNSGYSLHDWKTKKPVVLEKKDYETLHKTEEAFVHTGSGVIIPAENFAMAFIKSVSTQVTLANGDTYHYIPFWFKETEGKETHEIITFDKLPREVINIIRSLRGE